MMLFKLENPTASPRKLTQSILQIIDLLGLYQAELARILHLQCSDIGQMSNAQTVLSPDSDAWQYGLLLVRFYQALFDRFDGDGVLMCHWLRAQSKDLNGTPHLLIVDDDQLQQVVSYLESGSTYPSHLKC